MMQSSTSEIILSDGRKLSYCEYGNPGGIPVFVFHGMPGSRIFGTIFEEVSPETPYRLIAPDRPGYGLSDPAKKYSLDTLPDDMAQLASALNLSRIFVVGVSGGGPAALVCAAKIPDIVSATALVSAIGPIWIPNAMRDMMLVNRIMFTIGRYAPIIASHILAILIRFSMRSWRKFLESGTSPSPDITPAIFAVIANDQKESIRQHNRGLMFDFRTIFRRWNFDLAAINSKVFIWHGEADNLAPAVMARYMAERLPNCEAVYFPDEGHTDTLVRHAGEILSKFG